jgi:AICAR transformylase/IMP cyclohydrolase PurH
MRARPTPCAMARTRTSRAPSIGDLSGFFDRLNGKELSYNNLLDLDAAVDLIDDLATHARRALRHPQAQQCLRRRPEAPP